MQPENMQPKNMQPENIQVENLKHSRILIVDDEEANVHLLERTLERWGYTNLDSTMDSQAVLSLYKSQSPDLILLDLMMPHLDGYQVMEQLAAEVEVGDYLPILVLTADISPQVKRRALAVGAKDFLNKPFDQTELLLRISNMLELRMLHKYMQSQNRLLEERVHERTQQLEEAQIETLERLALAAEYRDDNTGLHAQRVGKMAAQLAWSLGLDGDFVQMLRRAAPLHDVGKIAVADGILLKPGTLDAEEWETMKTHTTRGAAMLSGSRSPLLQLAEVVALSHHERWDGTGYPNGLSGAAIPLAGRLVAVADVYDALTHERPYKRAWASTQAVEEITRQGGQQFDPRVVEAVLALSTDSLE